MSPAKEWSRRFKSRGRTFFIDCDHRSEHGEAGVQVEEDRKMTIAKDSTDGKNALLDEPQEHAQVEEVDFPLGDTTPTAKELEALVTPPVPAASTPELKATAEKQEPDVKIEKHLSGRRKLVFLLAGLVVIAIGISLFSYLRNRPRAVPIAITTSPARRNTNFLLTDRCFSIFTSGSCFSAVA